MEAPKITYYARIKSNLTGQQLSDWKMFDSTVWYYGKCNSLEGGESEYLIEYDIWNNEPGFNAGMYDWHNANALYCNLCVNPASTNSEDLELFKLGFPFLYGRCFSTNKRESWEEITISHPLTRLYGTVRETEGILYGNADHMILQTKIIMPANKLLSNNTRYPFNVIFTYSYE